jgi:hypothetical protein
MKGYFMYGIVVSYETYLDSKTGNTIEEVLINTEDVQGIFAGRDSDFVIVGTVLREVTPETEEPHEVPVMTRTGEAMILERVRDKFGITGDGHYYFVTR